MTKKIAYYDSIVILNDKPLQFIRLRSFLEKKAILLLLGKPDKPTILKAGLFFEIDKEKEQLLLLIKQFFELASEEELENLCSLLEKGEKERAMARLLSKLFWR